MAALKRIRSNRGTKQTVRVVPFFTANFAQKMAKGVAERLAGADVPSQLKESIMSRPSESTTASRETSVEISPEEEDEEATRLAKFAHQVWVILCRINGGGVGLFRAAAEVKHPQELVLKVSRGTMFYV